MVTSTRAVAVAAVLAFSTPALADEPEDPGAKIAGHTVDRPTDAAIQGFALAGGLALMLVPIRDHDLWARELFDGEEALHDTFSRRAAALSDVMLAASLAAPAAYLMGTTIDDADGDRLLLYGETIAINGMLAEAAKRIVQRPRPYMYSQRAAVKRYAREHGDDGMQSFYSGHAALSFGAAVSGAYLLGSSTDNRAVHALVLPASLMVAAATANLRVRAGKHYYSDVVIGAAIGITVGYVVPALHADADPYVPSGEEIAAGVAGILAGMLISQLIPLEHISDEVTGSDTRSALRNLRVSPTPMGQGQGHGMGLAISGGF